MNQQIIEILTNPLLTAGQKSQQIQALVNQTVSQGIGTGTQPK